MKFHVEVMGPMVESRKGSGSGNGSGSAFYATELFIVLNGEWIRVTGTEIVERDLVLEK